LPRRWAKRSPIASSACAFHSLICVVCTPYSLAS
jgi:hypothetical protein